MDQIHRPYDQKVRKLGEKVGVILVSGFGLVSDSGLIEGLKKNLCLELEFEKGGQRWD